MFLRGRGGEGQHFILLWSGGGGVDDGFHLQESRFTKSNLEKYQASSPVAEGKKGGRERGKEGWD